jgi:hypothetical protein
LNMKFFLSCDRAGGWLRAFIVPLRATEEVTGGLKKKFQGLPK